MEPRAYDTVARFLGKGGWNIIEPMFQKHMENHGLLECQFQSHNGMYITIRNPHDPNYEFHFGNLMKLRFGG